ncbi:hypothetical protein ACLKA7_009478 [Drosophila subpalustris]
MELFVRFLLITVKFAVLLLHPFQYLTRIWARSQLKENKLPAIGNRLITYNLLELRNRLRARQLTSVELVTVYIERIKEVNPKLNAIVEERFESALREAADVDRLIANANGNLKNLRNLFEKQPLLGLPMTVKESCALAGMSFAVGSLARRQLRTTTDGAVVARMRHAGAIPLLVSATPEYCYSIDADTLLNGRSVNPYDFGCTPGGSSGGEGALNGAGASLFGIGSDIAGSIRIPSLFCGVFGHKPTGGVVTVAGHFPYSSDEEFQEYLVLGPITRFATDLTPLLEIMAGEFADQLRLHEPVELRHINVHYALSFPGLNGFMHQSVDWDIQDVILQAVDHLEKLGLQVQQAKLPGFRNSLEISLSGIARLTNMQFILEGKGKGLVWKSLGQLLRSLCGKSRYTTNAIIFDLMRRLNAFMPAQRLDTYRREGQAVAEELTRLLGENGVMLFPTMHAPASRHGWTSLQLWGVDYTLIFNVLGFPVTHVPMGLNDLGLPIGFSVVAAPFQDRLCLRMAVELERAFGGWLPPTPVQFVN